MIWVWVNLYHMYLFRLILQAKSFVLFYLWYSSCFNVKCWFYTFPKWCSHISMGVLILLFIEIVMSILSNRCASLQVDPIISTFVRSILSFLNGVCFIRPQVAFVFPPSHPFLQGLRFLNQVSFLLMGSLSILFLNVLTWRFSWRC